MPVDIVVGVRDPQEKRRRYDLASRVIRLVDAPIPEARMLCLLDGVDCQYLKDLTGGVNRGLQSNDPDPALRRYIRDRLLELGEPESLTEYRSLVYVHGTTCSTDIGLAMTLAHEYQHHKQSIGLRPEYIGSFVIGKCDELVRARALIWSDIPHEREARIVSKRVAVVEFGAEVVQRYIERQITDAVSKMNGAVDDLERGRWSRVAADWLFIQRVDVDVEYDFALDTQELYLTLGRFRRALEQTQACFRDFRAVELDHLFKGECG